MTGIAPGQPPDLAVADRTFPFRVFPPRPEVELLGLFAAGVPDGLVLVPVVMASKREPHVREFLNVGTSGHWPTSVVESCVRVTTQLPRGEAKLPNFGEILNSSDRTRTCDPGLMNPLFYQLSYAGI